jgi:hypothetical protein
MASLLVLRAKRTKGSDPFKMERNKYQGWNGRKTTLRDKICVSLSSNKDSEGETMEGVVMVLIVIGVLAWVMRALTKNSAVKTSRVTAPKVGARHESSAGSDWLAERWALAERLRGATSGIFPGWYWDPMTERQAERLTKEGQKYSRSFTKGQASDLIGLKEETDENDLEVLKYFKRSTHGMNQTRAQHEVATLFQSEENKRSWEMRPAASRQKEFFRFFKIKPPMGLTKVDAEKLIRKTTGELGTASDSRVGQWNIYDEILEQLEDPELRDSYDIKKPSYALIREAIEALLKDGETWADMEVAGVDMVIERLIAIKPDLEKG